MTVQIIRGNALHLPLADGTVDLVCTSPPYFGLRSYQDGCPSCSGPSPDSYRVKTCSGCGETTSRVTCHNGCGVPMKWTAANRAPNPSCPDCGGTGKGHYDGQLGSEATPAEFVDALLAATREMVRVLKPSGSIWVNLGDKYAGSRMDGSSGLESAPLDHDPRKVKLSGLAASQGNLRTTTPGIRPKSLSGIPWRYALACIDQLGLILRAEIIWNKPNGLPESVTDRVRRSHEQWFHLVKQPRYYSAVDEIREQHAPKTLTHRGGGQAYGNDRNPDNHWGNPNGQARIVDPLGKLPGSVWTIPTEPLTVPPHLGVDHFAAYPTEWPRRIITGWSPPGICTACGQGRRPEAPREQYGLALRTAREQVGLTRAALAKAIGCHERSIIDWEDEGHLPREDAWEALDSALGLGLTRSQFVAVYDQAVTGYTDTPRRREALAAGASRPYTLRTRNIGRTTGYVCGCPTPDAPTRPSVVLDPFGGTGTTALVADVLGRHAIHIDLSADYNRLAEWRINDPASRAKAARVEKPPPVIDGQLSLLDGGAA